MQIKLDVENLQHRLLHQSYFLTHWSRSAVYVSEAMFRRAGSLADSQGTEFDMEFLSDCTHWQAVSS